MCYIYVTWTDQRESACACANIGPKRTVPSSGAIEALQEIIAVCCNTLPTTFNFTFGLQTDQKGKAACLDM